MGFWLPRPGNARGEGRERTEGREQSGEEGSHSICSWFSLPGPEWKEPAHAGGFPTPTAPLCKNPNCSPTLGSPVRGWDTWPRITRSGSEGLGLPPVAGRQR